MNGLIRMAGAIASLGSSLETDAVLSSIVHAAADLVPQALGATVQILDPAGRLVTGAATAALDSPHLSGELDPGIGAAELAYQERGVVNIADVRSDTRYLLASPSLPYRSLLAVPLSLGRRVMGVLTVVAEETGAFHEHEPPSGRSSSG